MKAVDEIHRKESIKTHTLVNSLIFKISCFHVSRSRKISCHWSDFTFSSCAAVGEVMNISPADVEAVTAGLRNTRFGRLKYSPRMQISKLFREEHNYAAELQAEESTAEETPQYIISAKVHTKTDQQKCTKPVIGSEVLSPEEKYYAQLVADYTRSFNHALEERLQARILKAQRDFTACVESPERPLRPSQSNQTNESFDNDKQQDLRKLLNLSASSIDFTLPHSQLNFELTEADKSGTTDVPEAIYDVPTPEEEKSYVSCDVETVRNLIHEESGGANKLGYYDSTTDDDHSQSSSPSEDNEKRDVVSDVNDVPPALEIVARSVELNQSTSNVSTATAIVSPQSSSSAETNSSAQQQIQSRIVIVESSSSEQSILPEEGIRGAVALTDRSDQLADVVQHQDKTKSSHTSQPNEQTLKLTLKVGQPEKAENTSPVFPPECKGLVLDAHWREYKALLENLQRSSKAAQIFASNISVKKFALSVKMFINTRVNSLGNMDTHEGRGQMVENYWQLNKLISGKEVTHQMRPLTIKSESQKAYCLYITAEALVKQAMKVVSDSKESAYSLAAVAIGLCLDFPMFFDLLVAMLYDKCPWLVPYFKITEELSSEKWSSFVKEQSGIIRFFAALLIVPPPPERKTAGRAGFGFNQPNNIRKNPLGLGVCWRLLAATAALKPQPFATAILLYEILNASATSMRKTYGVQYLKMLLCFQSELVPQLEKICSRESRSSFNRLESLLSEFLSTNR